jgi:hypothetical protein
MTIIQPPGVLRVLSLLKLKWDILVTFSLPEFNLKKQMCPSWAFHVNCCSESSSIYDMIMDRDLLGESGIIMNFNNQKVICDAETIPMKARDIALLHQ